MKTIKQNLNFKATNVAELNNNNLNHVIGGGITTTSNITKITDIINMSKDTLCTSDAK